MRSVDFLPPLILRHDREKPWMEWVEGTVLFADVSGFTPMSEALSVLGAEGAEILTDILNRYFADMIGIIHVHGGQVMKFGGDAILCFFPESSLSGKDRQAAGGRRQEEAKLPNLGLGTWNLEPGEEAGSSISLPNALAAAWKMQEGMGRFQKIKTPVKRFALKMKIGIAHGECLLAGVGDPAVRCDYVFAGDPVDLTSDAEHHAVAGEIVFAGEQCKMQDAKCKMEIVKPGFWRILDIPAEFETRNQKLDAVPAPPSSASGPPSSALRPFLIAEVHDMVASGHTTQVGALLEIVPVFLKFAGFTYTREGFDLPLFDAFFRTLMEVTERHGGRLNRISMGDKGSTAFLLFGAPNPLEKKELLASQWALDIMAALRGPEGCPWDKEQTRDSLKPFLVEETYEVLEAIDEDSPRKIKEELGDLLFQIIFHARVAEEKGEFTIDDVLDAISEKMIRRHPHVFGEKTEKTSAQVLSDWEQLKKTEKGNAARKSILEGVPKEMPALTRAHRLQERAARVGFEWDRIDDVFAKLEEELGEFKETLAAKDPARMEDELGDVFFVLVNISRYIGVNPEDALRKTISKFISRFQYIEESAKTSGRELSDMTLEEMDSLWDEAKERGHVK